MTVRPWHVLTALCVWLLSPGVPAQDAPPVPDYVGSAACAECHGDAYARWQDSHHSWAWRPPTGGNVLGDFADATFEHNGVTSRFSLDGDAYVVETDGPDGTLTHYPLHSTVGVAPLQQYLLETAPGRLQSLDVVWDVERRRWYHLYPDAPLTAADGLHWTGPYKTWNARCAECHATDYDKAYDPRTRRYASRQAEIGVGCEACHGPGAAHVAWARAPGAFQAADWSGIGPHGFTVTFAADDPQAEVNQCAGCHARREPLGDASPVPGTPFADSYRLALLRDGLYHADGQILDEVYVYGSFLQSKMHARGVRCSDCHQPHAAGLKAAGNVVCTQCHNPAGNDRFPTLPRADYDTPGHHFHRTGEAGSRCVDCHMPAQLYMVIDGRRDHSFRVPRPDLSVSIGTPNACTGCHDDRDAAWAADQVRAWYPDGRSGQPHFATAFAAARSEARTGILPATARQLGTIAGDADEPAIVRATALNLLQAAPGPIALAASAAALADPDPLVRGAALPLQRHAPPVERMQAILLLLSDPRRAVRIEAARALLGMPVVRYPPAIGARVQAAMREYQQSLADKADFPETQMVLAGTALTMRQLTAAERAFATATAMDPQLADAWIMQARLQLERRDLAAAQQTLQRAVAAAPADGRLQQWLGNVELAAGRPAEARAALQEAVRLRPDDPAVLADRPGSPSVAIKRPCRRGRLAATRGKGGRAFAVAALRPGPKPARARRACGGRTNGAEAGAALRQQRGSDGGAPAATVVEIDPR